MSIATTPHVADGRLGVIAAVDIDPSVHATAREDAHRSLNPVTEPFSRFTLHRPSMDIDDYVTRADGAESQIFDWGTIRWLDGDGLTAGTGLTLGVVRFDPKAANDEHYHPNCEETLYLTGGRLEHTLGDEATVLEPGEALHIPADVPHMAENLGDEPATAVIAYNSAEREIAFTGN